MTDSTEWRAFDCEQNILCGEPGRDELVGGRVWERKDFVGPELVYSGHCGTSVSVL